jgi:predicted phage replisome organizer
MAEIKWIKLCTDVFDDEKIMLIESMPEADSIIVIWFKLLCFAGKQNNGGVFMLNDRMLYNDEMLAAIFRRPINLVRLALTTFENFGMVEIINNAYTIPNWEKHQNVDKMDEIREYNRLKQQESRARRRLLKQSNVCQYCGGEATGYDHIVAKFNGGTDDDANLIPCCKRCNSSKRDKNVLDFLNLNIQEINLETVCKNEKLAKFVRYNGKYFVSVNDSQLTCQPCQDIDKEGDKEKESHSFTLSREETKLKFMGGTLGQGVVMLSDEQMDDLLDKLTIDEFNKYVGIVAECELNGKPYKKKTHYQAILDMVAKDRRCK